MLNRGSESFLADVREYVEIPDTSSGRGGRNLVDLAKAADLPHGVFAAYMREYQNAGYGLPDIPPEFELPLARLESEIPLARDYRPYLTRRIAHFQDVPGHSDEVIDDCLSQFEQRLRAHVAGLRASQGDWENFAMPEDDEDEWRAPSGRDDDEDQEEDDDA